MSATVPSPSALRAARVVTKAPLRRSRQPKAVAGTKPDTFSRQPLEEVTLHDPFTVPAVDSDEPYYVVANAGDHAAVHQFLQNVFQSPPADAFLATLDDPFYEPSDRVLVRRGHRVLSHIHTTKRSLHFGDLRFPIAGVWGLGTLPEFRGRAYATNLLRFAERHMIEDGSLLGMLRTRDPHFFRPWGWAVCGRHVRSKAGTRPLMVELTVAAERFADQEPLTIRPWRQVELPGLMRLYRDHTANAFGCVERTENYWRWLISRKHFDHLYVAIEGPDNFELDPTNASIVGYCVVRDDEILELVASPQHPRAAFDLLARACGEAIERDQHTIELHAPHDDRMHELFRAASGACLHHEVHQGEVFMVKLLDPLEVLRRLCPVLHARADRAKLPRPAELSLAVEDARYRLVLTRRSVKVSCQPRLTRSHLSCNGAEFTRLLLGHLDVHESVAAGRLEASTRVALDTARVLFPRVPFWRPPLDDLYV
ncbi:MAG: GNAT family N-acetyltransferase [Pirellulales bacterium]|nr:GNAT family N-acetyltransferase [Pirellulales bacterium]